MQLVADAPNHDLGCHGAEPDSLSREAPMSWCGWLRLTRTAHLERSRKARTNSPGSTSRATYAAIAQRAFVVNPRYLQS